MSLGLSRHLGAHKSDARCVTVCNGLVASGGRDSLLKLWLLGGEVFSVQEAKWVNAVTSFAPGHLKSCMHGGIVTGGQDGWIRIYSLEGQQLHLQHELQAHSAPVCSLSWLDEQGKLLLISGGWDAVAKIWEFESAEGSTCHATILSGHENNVCVLGLANGDIITGSSGLRDQASDCIIGFQLRVWREALVVQAMAQEHGGHTGAIRDLAAIPLAGKCSAFASASNDGTVCVWHSTQGSGSETAAKYSRVFILAVPSESFVFSVCYAASFPNNGNTLISGTIFTGDDSGELCMFDLPMFAETAQGGVILPVQRIRHPNTLWSVAVIAAEVESPQTAASEVAPDACARESLEVATACADGSVRIFSTNGALHLPPAERHESLNPQPEALPLKTEGYTMSTTLPRASERGRFNGVQIGTISLFLDDEEEGVTQTGSAAAVVAFQWLQGEAGVEAGWVRIGRVFDPIPKASMTEQQTQQQKQELDGEYFDQLIPVEVDSASKGQLSLLLGVNMGDDPKSVAAKFCQKHGLMDEYIPQIAMFVEASV